MHFFKVAQGTNPERFCLLQKHGPVLT